MWKWLVFILGLLAGGLFVQKLQGQEMSCEISMVTWQDAVIRIKVKGTVPDADLLIPVISFGCVRETETAVVVVHSFTNGEIDDFLSIPKSWTVKITPLHKKEENAPQANSQKGNTGKAPPVVSKGF